MINFKSFRALAKMQRIFAYVLSSLHDKAIFTVDSLTQSESIWLQL